MLRRILTVVILIGIVNPMGGHAAAQDRQPDATVSFNRDIRPILADRCFVCHGPDSASREAGLRFDREDSVKQPLEDTGNRAVVPGRPEQSMMLVRLLATDPDLKMPPAGSDLAVSGDEINLIRQWIQQGAKWERHWSFIPPIRSRLPEISDPAWPVNFIDHFILHRLDQNGLRPTRPANRERWLRRVTFDLTGLPPTISELDDFLADSSDAAFEKVVDRLLKSRAFGERMAQEWLDVARYGDTDGLFEDHPRSIFPWRDWVVDAFNRNLPYSQFLTWQLAGDLLPNASIEQRVATGFLRNNPTSNEGGIIDEDYRVKYLVDRVNTTATAMMGLTLECAQCHDHKYDPMTQREYYQFAGFFNSLIGNGNTKGSTAPTQRRYSLAQAQRIPEIDSELAEIAEQLKATPTALTADFQKWTAELDRPVEWRSYSIGSTADIEQRKDGWLATVARPGTEEKESSTSKKMRGRFVRLEMPKDHVGFLTLSEVQVFSAGSNVALTGRATQSSVGYSSPATKAIDGNHNGTFASCSCTNSERNAWWEVDLGAEFPVDSVAVWNRTDCCPERLDQLSIRILSDDRKVVAERILSKAQPRNALPANARDVEAELREFVIDLQTTDTEQTVAALRFESQLPMVLELVGGELVSKQAGTKPVVVKFNGDGRLKLTNSRVLVGLESPQQVNAEQSLRLKIRSADFNGLRVTTTASPTAASRASLPEDPEKRLAHFRGIWPGFMALRSRQSALQAEKKKIETGAPLTMVASDMPTPRKNYLLIRGEYDQRGDVVETAGPQSIMDWSEELPRNRLGLAGWLTDPNHPLTARVAVNRYWQMIFGRGIVRTSEDFGTQGAMPDHQQLLDFLAVSFVESGWDVKQLLRHMVLSATYRQASIRSQPGGDADPENRLLGRGPRRRLPAEFVRDHALAVSGLLKQKMGGPGVHPYQPGELFGANAIGSSNAKFSQSTGDDLYRRSLYTYWKRQIPAANMRILGADGRTTCRTRREQTNTPLQALVLLNDPQFVEAARVFAERIMKQGGTTPKDRLSLAFRLATSRQIHRAELGILLQEYEDRLHEFQQAPDLAAKYLAGGGQHKPASGTDQAQLAAYAAVCSLILNLDESISSN